MNLCDQWYSKQDEQVNLCSLYTFKTITIYRLQIIVVVNCVNYVPNCGRVLRQNFDFYFKNLVPRQPVCCGTV